MPFERVKKPGERDSLNENDNNGQVQNRGAIGGRVPNSVMNDLLSGGMNNNNNNQRFNQRDAEPKADNYDEKMKAAKGEVFERNEGIDDNQLLQNSLGNIVLSCSILLSRGKKPALSPDEKPMSRRGKKAALSPDEELEKIRDELETVRKKRILGKREEIESVLNKITAWLDQYGGNDDEVDEIRREIARCNWVLPFWEKWRVRVLEKKAIIALYMLNSLMVETEARERRTQANRLYKDVFDYVYRFYNDPSVWESDILMYGEEMLGSFHDILDCVKKLKVGGKVRPHSFKEMRDLADENIEFLSTKLLPCCEACEVDELDINFDPEEGFIPYSFYYCGPKGLSLCKEMIDFWSMIKDASFQEESSWKGSSWEKFFSEWKDFSCDTEDLESSM